MTSTRSPKPGFASRMPWSATDATPAYDARVIVDAVGDARTERVADRDHAGMRRSGRHAVARLERVHAGAAFEHGPGGGIAERDGVLQPGAHLAQGRADAFLAHLVEHAPDVLRPLAGLPIEAPPRHIDDMTLGARRDQRHAGGNRHLSMTR